MKNLLISLLVFTFFVNFANGQHFKADELIRICRLSLSDGETYLLSKGYSMVDTKEDSLKSYVEFENEKMQHLVRLTKYFMGIVDIEYSTLKATEFVQFKNYLRLNKYKLEGTKVEKDEVSTITTMYSKGKYAFWLYSFSRKAKSGDNSTFNWYRIQISIYP